MVEAADGELRKATATETTSLFCKHECIAVPWSLTEAAIENTSNSNWVNWRASGAFQVERSNLDHVRTESVLDQLEFFLINDGTTEG